MKLVIDIPENTYKRIQTLASSGYFEHDICGNSMRRIADGKPLDDVLDDIRAEINDWQTDIYDNEYDAEEHDFVFEQIYEIMGKYKTESEG